VPLQGHSHEIETVLTDGHLVASHCLGGRICVWDSLTGENLLVCTVLRVNCIQNKKVRYAVGSRLGLLFVGSCRSHMLNMELDLQSFFGLHVHSSILIG
jgi:hypothetical protein